MSNNADPDRNENAHPTGQMSPTLWAVIAALTVFLVGMAVYTHWPQPKRAAAVISAATLVVL